MASFQFGSLLPKAAAAVSSPSAESFSTASGGDTSLGKLYAVSLVSVDDKCLRVIGHGRSSICLKVGCTKHAQIDRLEMSGEHLIVVNTSGNGIPTLTIPSNVVDHDLRVGAEVAMLRTRRLSSLREVMTGLLTRSTLKD